LSCFPPKLRLIAMALTIVLETGFGNLKDLNISREEDFDHLCSK